MIGSPTVLANLRVPGADGTPLATDVYLPPGAPAPVLVLRTCYGRGAHLAEGLGWARRGYAFVVQDVRGRYDSDGEWRPYRGERADGHALATWIAAQRWRTGPLVPIGASYAAYTALAFAVSAPEPVGAVISQVPAMGFREVKIDPSGILRLAEHVHWWLSHAGSRTSREGLLAEHPDVLSRLPVAGLADRFWVRTTGWWEAVASREPSPEAITDEELAGLSAPSLHIGGWHDLLVPETLRQWRLAGGAHDPRPTTDLLAGPWPHRLPPLGESIVDWLGEVLGGADRLGARSRVRPVGGDGWRPLPADRAPVTLSGAPGATFTYHPADPFPSLPGEADRRALDARTDVVRIPGAPLDRELVVAGAPTARVAAHTTAESADWVVRLNRRDASGEVYALSSGAVVAGPGTGEHEIPMTPTAAVVPPGSRLELEITSSDFPHLARNLGTPDRYHTTDLTPATHTIHTASITIPTDPR